MSSGSAVWLFLNALIPFSMSSIWNGDANMGSVASCFGRFSLCGMWSLCLFYHCVLGSEPPGSHHLVFTTWSSSPGLQSLYIVVEVQCSLS